MEAKQRDLQYSIAESEYQHRHSQLRTALLAVGCRGNPSLVLIAELIFAETAGGLREYLASYDTLADPPRGGCCGRKKAIDCVRQLEDSGMLIVARSSVSGRDTVNCYTLNRERLAELAGSRGAARRFEPAVSTSPRREELAARFTECPTDTPECPTDTPECPTDTPECPTRTPPGPGPGVLILTKNIKPGAREPGTRGVLKRRLPIGVRGVAVLRDTAELLDVFRDVCEHDPIGELSADCEQDRLRWVTAAEHALAKGDSPVHLFTAIVKRGLWSNLTEAADEAARRRLVAYDRELRE